MDELQGGANKWHKPFLYQNYGYPPSQPNDPTRPAAAPPAPRTTATATRPPAETAKQTRARLHRLFNTWIPRTAEFYNIYDTLDLTAQKVEAIQDEVIKYHVKSAQAEWETAPAHLPPQRQGEASTKKEDEDDPLALGLPRAIAEGRRACEVNSLLD